MIRNFFVVDEFPHFVVERRVKLALMPQLALVLNGE
jgi:hypothetical protein